MSAPALATGSCGTGPWLTTAAAGTLAPGEETWYRASAKDWTYVDANGSFVGVRVLNTDCSQVLCTGAGVLATCPFGYVGQVNVAVTNSSTFTVPYTVFLDLGNRNKDGANPLPSAPECRDGLDNDANGQADYPDDARCTSPDDDSESDPLPVCTPDAPVCVTVDDDQVLYDVTEYHAMGTNTEKVLGALDGYVFDLPGGTQYPMECLVLNVGDTEVNPCAAAGGTFFGRLATLTEGRGNVADPFHQVGVCTADYAVTVAATEVAHIPGYSLC